jgi:hypothetical protein
MNGWAAGGLQYEVGEVERHEAQGHASRCVCPCSGRSCPGLDGLRLSGRRDYSVAGDQGFVRVFSSMTPSRWFAS